jgi:phospholipid/cholesterol/gamma-HCH transport system permease protein
MASTATPLPLPRPFRWLRPVVAVPLDALEDLGEQMSFFGRALAWFPRALPAYWKEIVRLIAEVSLGSGALAVILGSVGVIGFLTFFTGTEVGL